MKRSKLSIIILSYNTKDLLKNCLISVIKNSPYFTEIIVVDNGSTDSSVELIKNFKKKLKNKNIDFKIILNKKNLGFAKGNNQGIKVASGDYIMLLNADTIVLPKTINKLVDYLKKSSNKVAVSPLLIFSDGRPQIDYYMRFPNLWQIFLYHNPLIRPVVMKIPILGSLIAQKEQKKPFRVDQLPGAAIMASKEIWKKTGFFDENYHFLFEDVDWCWRARKLGVELIVVPQGKIIHIGGASWKKRLKDNSNEFYYQFFASMLLFVRKNYGKIKAEIFKWAIILNFLLTLKTKLAWQFFKNNGQQMRFLK